MRRPLVPVADAGAKSAQLPFCAIRPLAAAYKPPAYPMTARGSYAVPISRPKRKSRGSGCPGSSHTSKWPLGAGCSDRQGAALCSDRPRTDPEDAFTRLCDTRPASCCADGLETLRNQLVPRRSLMATGGLLPPGGGYCRMAAHREAMPTAAVSLQFIA